MTDDASNSLESASDRALARATARWKLELGSGSVAELSLLCARRLSERASVGDELSHGAEEVCLRVEQAHVARYGHAALRAELEDERARDAAAKDDGALVKYEEKWARRLSRLMRAQAARWRVAGLSEEEVRDALTLRLIEAIRGAPESREAHARAGEEWGFTVVRCELAALRKRFRLAVTPMDLGDAPLTAREPTQEDRWLACEADVSRAMAEARAQTHLNLPQRRWLEAMKSAARSLEFFQASDALNLSAASRLLGKNRSSALRAYRELQIQFMRELERLA